MYPGNLELLAPDCKHKGHLPLCNKAKQMVMESDPIDGALTCCNSSWPNKAPLKQQRSAGILTRVRVNSPNLSAGSSALMLSGRAARGICGEPAAKLELAGCRKVLGILGNLPAFVESLVDDNMVVDDFWWLPDWAGGGCPGCLWRAMGRFEDRMTRTFSPGVLSWLSWETSILAERLAQSKFFTPIKALSNPKQWYVILLD